MEITILALPAVIVALVQVIKRTGFVPDKFLPLLDVVLGIAGGLLVVSLNVGGAVAGLLAGLSAAGVYDLVKEPAQTVINKLG